MDGLRDDFLARAVLAGDEHVSVGGADARNHLQHRLHGARFGDERGQSVGPQEAVLRLQHIGLALHPVQIELCPQHGEQPRVVPRLLDEVRGTTTHRFDGEFHAAPRGHHDDGHAQAVALDLREQIDALRARRGVARVIHIHQDGVVAFARKTLDELPGRCSAVQLVAFRAQQDLQRVQDGRLIVGDEQTRPLPLLRVRAVCGGALACAAHAGCHSTLWLGRWGLWLRCRRLGLRCCWLWHCGGRRSQRRWGNR